MFNCIVYFHFLSSNVFSDCILYHVSYTHTHIHTQLTRWKLHFALWFLMRIFSIHLNVYTAAHSFQVSVGRWGRVDPFIRTFVLWFFAHFQSKVNFATVKSPQHSWTKNPYMYIVHSTHTAHIWIMDIVLVLTPFGKSCVIALLEKFPT